MYDLIFLGLPWLGGLLILGGSIYLGIKSRYIWYVAPAFLGVLTLLPMLRILQDGPNDPAMSFRCTSAVFWIVIGLALLSVVNKRAAARNQPK